jgi:hypothetical protein
MVVYRLLDSIQFLDIGERFWKKSATEEEVAIDLCWRFASGMIRAQL